MKAGQHAPIMPPPSTAHHRNPHCNKNPIYVFPEKELRGLGPNVHIHVSVSDLYIPRMGPRIVMQQNRQTDRGNIYIYIYIYISQTHEGGN
jgi:hypothetical protein